MSIQASCPNCGMTYALADQQAGQRVRCKKCQEAFKVPSAEERVVQQRPADTPPTRPGRPTERPSRSREDDRPTPSRRDESAAPRASKKSRDEAPYPLIPMPLLIGGLVAGAVLLIGVIGAAAWIFTSANISPTTAGNTVIDDNVANGPDQPNAKEPDNSNVAKGLEELKAAGWYRQTAQAFAVLLPIQSVGVMGDYRTYDYVVGLRAVTSSDGMTADFYPFDMKFIAHVATRIVNEVKGVNRVVYDVTSKPPGTIEWE